MYKRISVSVVVLAVLLAGGMTGVAVADGPPSDQLQLDGEITVDDHASESDDEPDDPSPSESFEVSDLEAPDKVAVGEPMDVTATISNPTEFETNQSVEFRLDGDVVDRQTLELDAQANQTVSITLDSEELGVGSYIHGFLTTDRGELAVVEIIPFAELDFDEQESDGETLVVDSATLSEGGFVAIYDDDELIGVSDYLDDGIHEEIEIEFDDGLDDESTLTAIAYLDTTDTEELEVDSADSTDEPYVDVDGELITDSATVTVPLEDDEAEEDDADDEAEEDDADDEAEENDADDEAEEDDADDEAEEDDADDEAEENDADDEAEEDDADDEAEEDDADDADDDADDEAEEDDADDADDEAEEDEAEEDDADDEAEEDDADDEAEEDDADDEAEEDDAEEDDADDEAEEDDADDEAEEDDADDEAEEDDADDADDETDASDDE